MSRRALQRYRQLIILATLAFAAALILLRVEAATVPHNPRAHVQFYIRSHGLADPKQHPLVDRAYRVFSQVRASAFDSGRRTPRLKVVNSFGDPWAIALPDGHIVLSRRAVEICYQGVDLPQGDARLAFVLGHELAHLAKDDFWHMDVYMALAGDSLMEGLQRLLKEDPDKTKVKETQADDWGFIYAAIAGYPVNTLLGDDREQQDFFSYWMAQTHTRVDDRHPHPEERARLLQTRLRQLLGHVEYYQYGVRLLHFGRYDDAFYFLSEFQRQFPSREVFNNLGYLYLQKALQEMPPAQAYRYWLPLTLDVTTRADALRGGTRGEAFDLSEAARELLELAVEQLRRASELDPHYVPARVNLAIAYSYLDEPYQARAAVEEALALAEGDPEIQGLKALILAREGRAVDMWPHAVKLLEELLQQPKAPPAIRYNLARLLEERGRYAAALPHWNSLARQAERLPPPFYAQVCLQKELDAPCPNLPAKTISLPWTLPVPVGLDLYEHEELKARLNSEPWLQSAFDWQAEKLYGHIFWQPDKASVLELDNYVEMVVLWGEALGSADELRARAGAPLSSYAVAGGTVWSYGDRWAALVSGDKVREVWVVPDQQ